MVRAGVYNLVPQYFLLFVCLCLANMNSWNMIFPKPVNKVFLSFCVCFLVWVFFSSFLFFLLSFCLKMHESKDVQSKWIWYKLWSPLLFLFFPLLFLFVFFLFKASEYGASFVLHNFVFLFFPFFFFFCVLFVLFVESRWIWCKLFPPLKIPAPSAKTNSMPPSLSLAKNVPTTEAET